MNNASNHLAAGAALRKSLDSPAASADVAHFVRHADDQQLLEALKLLQLSAVDRRLPVFGFDLSDPAHVSTAVLERLRSEVEAAMWERGQYMARHWDTAPNYFRRPLLVIAAEQRHIAELTEYVAQMDTPWAHLDPVIQGDVLEAVQTLAGIAPYFSEAASFAKRLQSALDRAERPSQRQDSEVSPS